jgi:endonuclease YncB( thermonuclease family)
MHRRARYLPLILLIISVSAWAAEPGPSWPEPSAPPASALPKLPLKQIERLTGLARVIDGDTLELEGIRIRLHAIDAPEGRQTCRTSGREWACGGEARSQLESIIAGRPVTCHKQDIDRYGRMVGICTLGEADLGSLMVEQGWALAFRRYGADYLAQEEAAKAAGRGMWAASFIAPWEHRAGRRLAEEIEPAAAR